MRKITMLMQMPGSDGKLGNWIRLAAVIFMSQATIQVLGLLTGLLIIHLLPVQEYAYYTIANTVLGTMALLSDSGINNGVMSQGGSVWQDRAQLGAVMASGLKLRRGFSVVSLCISVPVLYFLLMRQGAGWQASTMMLFGLVPAFLATLTDSVLEIPFKLHQEIKALQTNQLMVGAGRLLLTAALLLVVPFTFISLLSNGLPRLYGNLKLRRQMNALADLSAPASPVISQELMRIVKRIFPLTVYYAYSSQIAIWIISLSGSAMAVAQLGALGRISMIMSLFSILFATLITPRFARLQASRTGLLSRFSQTMLLLTILTVVVMLGCKIFAPQILMLLGPKYANLQAELLLSVAAACVNLVSGCVYGLYSSRGWTMQPFISIGFNLVCMLACIRLLNVSTLQGVLWFNICCALVQLLIGLIFCARMISKMPLQPRLS